jgi:hypothetical protein
MIISVLRKESGPSFLLSFAGGRGNCWKMRLGQGAYKHRKESKRVVIANSYGKISA